MATANVLLREDVFHAIHARRAWPHDEKFKEWVRDIKDKTLPSSVLPTLRKRGAAPLDIIELMIEYQLSSDLEQQQQIERAQAFALILADLGFSEPATGDIPNIAKAITKSEVDYLGVGADSIIAAIKSGIALSSAVSARATEAEIKALILWMYVDLGRRICGEWNKVSADEAKRVAESVIKIPLEEYQQRALSWKTKHAWTIAPVRVGHFLVGAPIILPLKVDVYERIRAGEAFASEVTPDDLEVPSKTIFVEGISEARNEFAGHSGNTTLHLRAAIARQLGYFCAIQAAREESTIRLLSRQASPISTTRLERSFSGVCGTRIPWATARAFRPAACDIRWRMIIRKGQPRPGESRRTVAANRRNPSRTSASRGL